MRHHHHPRARARRRHDNRWYVHARVERFTEPALLLLLAERPAHGYELLERLPELTGDARVEMGNLYRLLRGLEDEGLVSSEWDASAPGPAKRRYELTEEGTRLLARWADALRDARQRIDTFIERYDSERR
jgi:PadR family transcriptional regulator PadR